MIEKELLDAVAKAFMNVERHDGPQIIGVCYEYLKEKGWDGRNWHLSHNPFLRNAIYLQAIAERWREKLNEACSELGLVSDLKFPEVDEKSLFRVEDTRLNAAAYSGAARIIYYYVTATGKLPKLTTESS